MPLKQKDQVPYYLHHLFQWLISQIMKYNNLPFKSFFKLTPFTLFLLAQGRRFSPDTPASSTTKTGRHDIAESGVKHQKINQIITLFSKCKGRCSHNLFHQQNTCRSTRTQYYDSFPTSLCSYSLMLRA